MWYLSSWRDLRRRSNAGHGLGNKPEITPPSHSYHRPDGTLGGNQAQCGLQLAHFNGRLRPDLAIAEECEHLISIARARRFRIEDQRLSDKVRQPQWRSVCDQRVIEWQSDDKTFIAQELTSDAWIIYRNAAEAHVNTPLLQGGNLLQA